MGTDALTPALLPLIPWLAVAAFATFAVFYYQWGLRRDRYPRNRPAVAIIIPVRGASKNLSALWSALTTQNYPGFRVIFAVESMHDPAFAALASIIGAADSPAAQIVVAGPADDAGQKIENQLAALSTVHPPDEVIVFADADIVPPRDWLARLVCALDDPRALAASGYRWMEPADDRLSTRCGCMINAAIASLPKPISLTLAWGGSMALRRETLLALDLEAWWRGAISDDLQLTRAVWHAGKGVYSPRQLLLRSPTSLGWRELFEFGRRQYIFSRLHAPWHWGLAAAATTLPIVGWIFAAPLALGGNRWAVIAIASAVALNQMRALLRRRIPRLLWRGTTDRRVALLDHLATPFLVVLHAAMIWSALFTRTLSWGGRVYRIDGPQRVRIVRQDLDAAG